MKLLAVCTRFSCELQTVFLFPAGPRKAQGLILFIDREYRAGMSAQRLCGLSVIFTAVRVSVCVSVCVCVCVCCACCGYVKKIRTKPYSFRAHHQYGSKCFSNSAEPVRCCPGPFNMNPVKWKKQFSIDVIESNLYAPLSVLHRHSASDVSHLYLSIKSEEPFLNEAGKYYV